MIERTALLATLKPVVTALEDSIRERALTTPEIAEHLEREHHKAITAERTAMSLEEWREGEITQAAVAWVLACVFVRFLEDNRLIDQPLIAGPGPRGAAALGHRSEYFQREPGHSDREYLESCFREVAAYPAVSALYDQRHNPLWRLGPTADGARALRETFTRVDPETGELVHEFTDPNFGTRFLGDLYQDLSEAAKKRYALLQTPDFVEEFILDRTLTPAIDEFGLETVRLIDPTCGSGHFLIGAFVRLFALWRDREPGTDTAVLAQRSLDQVAGVDLNPYATAIARFRLVITALRACGVRRLAEAPAFALNLATGDSLLHGPLPFEGSSMLFDAGRLDRNIAHVYESEDAAELKRILGRGYHAVVGNPPYIAVQDAALRDAYRARYASCHGKYVLTVPFMERFFELAQVRGGDGRNVAGFVGKITGNSFMKREFGEVLVERFLPSVDLQLLIDASGAYIPGHGTPTVLLFGRGRLPTFSMLKVVDGIRGEPGQPDDPSRGKVWTAIKRIVDSEEASSDYVRVSDIARADILKHPMTLGAGRSLRIRLEKCARLAGHLTSAGFASFPGLDDAFVVDPATGHRLASSMVRPLVTGDVVRDWSVAPNLSALAPYGRDMELVDLDLTARWGRWLWRNRSVATSSKTFANAQDRGGKPPWWGWFQFAVDKLQAPLQVTWGEVSTHNHFALLQTGYVFKQTAPVLTFNEVSEPDAVYGLLGVLNSSTAGFWLRQVCQPKGSSGMGRGIYDEAWEVFSAFNASNVRDLPIPTARPAELAAALHHAAVERSSLLDIEIDAMGAAALSDDLGARAVRDGELTEYMISLQEELDWQVLAAFALAPADLCAPGAAAPPIRLGERAFEIVLARQVATGEAETSWFERHASIPTTEFPNHWPVAYREVVERRIALIQSDPDVGLIEQPEHKRRWNRQSWERRVEEALTRLVLDALEAPDVWSDLRPQSTAELTDHLRKTPRLVEALELLAGDKDRDLGVTVGRLVIGAAVPRLAAQRFTEKGLVKHKVWQQVWELQRAEDRGEYVAVMPVPPKLGKPDFRAGTYWEHRGKLDVPKERFVLIPNAERGADTSAVVGWAGWDEKDLARALAGRVTELRDQDAADAERVTPLLATVLELLPWIHQWHPESDPLFAGTPGAFFEGWLDGQLAELSLTRDTLRAWRPPAPTRGRKAKAPTT